MRRPRAKRPIQAVRPEADTKSGEGMQTMEDITSNGTSFALVHHEGEGDDALLGDTLVRLAEQIATALDCSECCVYEYIAERNALRAQALWSRVLSQHDIDWVGEMHRLADAPGFRRVVEDREVLVSYPDDDVDAATAGFETMEFWGERAAIWAPIVYGDQVLGMLELTEKERERTFTEADKRLVGQMAGLAAVALYNAQLSRAAEERNRQLSALIGASRAMTSTLDLDELLEVVCRQAALALDAGSSYIYEYDAEADAMVWLAEHQRDAVALASRSRSGPSTPSRTCRRTWPWCAPAGPSRCASTTRSSTA